MLQKKHTPKTVPIIVLNFDVPSNEVYSSLYSSMIVMLSNAFHDGSLRFYPFSKQREVLR